MEGTIEIPLHKTNADLPKIMKNSEKKKAYYGRMKSLITVQNCEAESMSSKIRISLVK